MTTVYGWVHSYKRTAFTLLEKCSISSFPLEPPKFGDWNFSNNGLPLKYLYEKFSGWKAVFYKKWYSILLQVPTWQKVKDACFPDKFPQLLIPIYYQHHHRDFTKKIQICRILIRRIPSYDLGKRLPFKPLTLALLLYSLIRYFDSDR